MTDGSTVGARSTFATRLWWSRRALALHMTLVVILPLFTWAFLWQVGRVRQGNELSWAYVFEWPFFAGYAVYLWWKLLHDQIRGAEPRSEDLTASGPPQAQSVWGEPAGEVGPNPDVPDEDEELAAYNRYLAELNASGRRKHW